MANSVEVLVEGGKASAGPPLGPALGPLGVNVMKVVQAINEKTAAFSGMKVPVKVNVDPKTKSFDISIGTPPTSQLLLAECKAEKGSGTPKSSKVGNITLEQAIKVSRMKQDSLTGGDLKARVLEVAGSANSCGITIENLSGKEFIAAVKAGQFDARIK